MYIIGDEDGGVFESEQDEFPAMGAYVPDSCEDTRRTLNAASKTWTLEYLGMVNNYFRHVIF